MVPEPPQRVDTAATAAHTDAQTEMGSRVGDPAAIFLRTAEALEQSAAMAEEHAERQRRSGDDEAAAKESEAAGRAADAARRARARAEAALAADGRHTPPPQ
jgi:hypothetical protein